MPGDPAVEPAERAAERLDLARSRGRGRACAPRAPRRGSRRARRGRPLEDLDLRVVAPLDLAPELVGLGEEDVGVEREDARLRLEREQHVEQHRLLLLEGAGERDLAGERAQDEREDLLGAQLLDRRGVRRRERLVTEQHLLQRVAAQPEPERLERDDFLRRDVPEVDRRAEVLDEPRLRRLRRRLPDEVVEVDRMLDLGDQAGAHLAVGPEDARRCRPRAPR